MKAFSTKLGRSGFGLSTTLLTSDLYLKQCNTFVMKGGVWVGRGGEGLLRKYEAVLLNGG